MTVGIATKSKGAKFKKSKGDYLYLERPTGIYYVRAQNALGKDQWRSLSTRSFSVAKDKALVKVAEIQSGMNGRSSALRSIESFKDAADIYRGRVQADTSLKPSSIDYRLKTIDGIFRSWPELKQLSFRSITPDACLAWAKTYREKIHGTRFNNTVDSFRHILDIAKEAGVITANPAMEIGKAKVTAKRLELPTREQFPKIVAAIRASGAWCAQDCADLVEFLAYSGCRIGEAGNVKWPDIDAKAGSIRIYGPDDTGTKNWQFRSVPILPAMQDLLDRLSTRDRIPRNPLRIGQNFVLNVTECREALANACEKVGAKRITHHNLRDLFVTRAIECGADIPTISRWVGHKDGGALLMKTYGHLRDEHSKAMAAKISF
jgi:integrase